MVMVRKLPDDVLVRRQNTGGITVSMRWQTLAFYLLSSIALSAKRNALIHDTMIGRCNGIPIVPMCLRIL
jgi:hypothetical protein